LWHKRIDVPIVNTSDIIIIIIIIMLHFSNDKAARLYHSSPALNYQYNEVFFVQLVPELVAGALVLAHVVVRGRSVDGGWR